MNHQRPTTQSKTAAAATTLLLLSISSSSWLLPQASAFSASSSSRNYDIIRNSNSLLDPISGTQIKPETFLSAAAVSGNINKRNKALVVLLPQLGEFDSAEYVEFLLAAKPSLQTNNIDLRIIGIGDRAAATNFCKFTNLPLENLYIDPNGTLHQELKLYCGPEFNLPDWLTNDVCKFFLRQLPGGVPSEDDRIRPVATAWLNYLCECEILLFETQLSFYFSC